MLLQSHGDAIAFLPALPKAWPNGEVRGMRTRGGYEVVMIWGEGRLKEAILTAMQSGACRIRSSYDLIIREEGSQEGLRLEASVKGRAWNVSGGRRYFISPV